MNTMTLSNSSLLSEGCTATIANQSGVFVIVTAMQVNGSDLIRLLSLCCQLHTRWYTRVSCLVALILNQGNALLVVTEGERDFQIKHTLVY